MKENDENQRCAVLVDDINRRILAATRDFRGEHPLQHCTILLIDLVSHQPVYRRENLLVSPSSKRYLLSNCSIYLSYEPCVMCSMALLHSRISTVYYLNKNEKYGALGSIYKIHNLKKTNHRFRVYRLML